MLKAKPNRMRTAGIETFPWAPAFYFFLVVFFYLVLKRRLFKQPLIIRVIGYQPDSIRRACVRIAV